MVRWILRGALVVVCGLGAYWLFIRPSAYDRLIADSQIETAHTGVSIPLLQDKFVIVHDFSDQKFNHHTLSGTSILAGLGVCTSFMRDYKRDTGEPCPDGNRYDRQLKFMADRWAHSATEAGTIIRMISKKDASLTYYEQNGQFSPFSPLRAPDVTRPVNVTTLETEIAVIDRHERAVVANTTLKLDRSPHATATNEIFPITETRNYLMSMIGGLEATTLLLEEATTHDYHCGSVTEINGGRISFRQPTFPVVIGERLPVYVLTRRTERNDLDLRFWKSMKVGEVVVKEATGRPAGETQYHGTYSGSFASWKFPDDSAEYCVVK